MPSWPGGVGQQCSLLQLESWDGTRATQDAHSVCPPGGPSAHRATLSEDR